MMEKSTNNNAKCECIFKCENPEILFRFPPEKMIRQVWLDRLGLDSVPLVTHTYGKICNRHFSPRMFRPNKKALTSTAVPDINFPGCEDLNFLNSKPEPQLGSQIKVIKPNMFRYNMDIEQIPRIITKPVITTSENSICHLKCKNAKYIHRFPRTLLALGLWLEQLDMDSTTRFPRTAGLCHNHFSRQMTTNKGLRNYAVPDLCLPRETIFKPEETEDCNAIVIEDDENPIIVDNELAPEILINPIENIKSVLSSNKEGILHVFQPGIENKANEEHVAYPENYIEGEYECVLKCPDVDRLFRFPNIESKRQHWLKQIGLTHCFHNTRICSRHFSDSMFLSSKKRLTKAAYPDINIPGPSQPRLTDGNITPIEELDMDITDLPQYIFVLTVFTRHTEVGAVVHGTKYVEHKIDKDIPMRERGLQVQETDLFQQVDVATLADDFSNDFDDLDDFEMTENINYEQQPILANKLKDHFFFSSKIGLYECLICGEILVDKDSSIKHQNLHDESSFLCPKCGEQFSTSESLSQHEIEEHLGRTILFRCPHKLCKKAFHSRRKLDRHLDEHLKRTKLNCGNCWRVFFSALKLQCHQMVCKQSFKCPK